MAIKRHWEPIEYSEYIALIVERDELKAKVEEYVRRARCLVMCDGAIVTDTNDVPLLIRDLAADKVTP